MIGPARFVYLSFKTVLIKQEVCEWDSIVLHFFDVTSPWASIFSDEFPDYTENINKQMLPPANSTIIKNQGRGFIQNLFAVTLWLGCVEIAPSANV